MNIFRKLFKHTTNTLASQFSYITAFQDGYALAILNEKIGYCSSHSIVIIDADYNIQATTTYKTQNKHLGKYLIATDSSKVDYQDVLLDENLKEVPNFSSLPHIFPETSNYATLIDAKEPGNHMYGLICDSPKILIEPSCNYIGDINKDLFFVKRPDKNFVYNAKLDIYIKVKADMIYPFKSGNYGLYLFKYKKHFGYLNSDFEVAIPASYSSLGNFDKNGYAPFQRNCIFGTINNKGEERIR